MKKISRILPLSLFCWSCLIQLAPVSARAEGPDNFLEKFMLETPEDSINPLFRQSMAVQRRSLRREGQLILGFQPSLDVNFGPYGNVGAGIEFGYAFSERFELNFLWIPYYLAIKKSVASQLDDLEFSSDGSAPDLEQAKKSAEYTLVFHWVPGYGKISFARDRAYRYDMFFDALVGWLKFKSSASPKVGIGFGNSIFFSDNFSLRYSLWGSYVNTPDLQSGKSGASLTGEFQLGFMFYL